MTTDLQHLQDNIEALLRYAHAPGVGFQAVCDRVIEELVDLTGSEFGFYGGLDAGQGSMRLLSTTNAPTAKTLQREINTRLQVAEGGLWAAAVQQGRVMLVNDFAAHPASGNLPAGHAPMQRLLVVPVVLNEQVVSLVAVANKAAPYNADDVALVETFATNAHLIIERKDAEAALQRSQAELSIRNRISEVFLTAVPDELYQRVLVIVLEALQSTHGTFGYVDDQGSLVYPSMAGEVWDSCRMSDKTVRFAPESLGGLWGRSLREKQVLYSNTPYRVPDGHMPIARSMSAPILYRDELIGHLHVANKPAEYTGEDCRVLAAIVGQIAPIMQARLQRDRVEHERMAAEAALRESEARFRAIAESSPDAIITADRRGTIVFWNSGAANLYGYRPEEILGKPARTLLPLRLRGKDRENFERLLADGVSPAPGGAVASYGLRKDGTEFPAEIAVSAWQAGDQLFFSSIIRDVRGRREAEEQIHNLSQELIRVQESERRRLSRDLHDNVAQNLSTLKIAVNTMFDAYPEIPQPLLRQAARLSDLLQSSIASVRELSYDLRPPLLDQLGMVRAVYEYCDEFAVRSGIGVDFFSAGLADKRLDLEIEINIYRLVQEALNNVARHSGAKSAVVRMVLSHPDIIVRIEDNGSGFSVKRRLGQAAKEKRMGIGSMQERVALLGGSMRIDSRKNQGTKVVVRIPYWEAAVDDEKTYTAG